jgi:hypothetical protein
VTAPDPHLARLFAMAYRQLIDGLHERLVEAGWTDVRPAFGFVLLAARRGPTTTTEPGVLMARPSRPRRSSSQPWSMTAMSATAPAPTMAVSDRSC